MSQRARSAACVGLVSVLSMLLASCGGSGPTAPSSPPASTPAPAPSPGPSGPSALSVSIVSGASGFTTNAYAPNPFTVPVGSTVTWTNNDITTHDAVADNKAFATPLIPPGGSASVTLVTAGRITYYCTIHPGMSGTITVQ